MLKGLPASGKSTFAEELVKGGGNWVHVNKDLLRTMLHFDEFSGRNEKVTINVEINLVKYLLKERNVIVDDTNLSKRHEDMWRGVATEAKAVFEIESFLDVSFIECVRRDICREKSVGSHVITNMAMQYQLIPALKDIVVCDIDGTIADGTHRLHHLDKIPRDWKSYFSKLSGDTPRQEVLDNVAKLCLETSAWLVLVSARPETYREETEQWLLNNNIPYVNLIMRGAHDRRDDDIVKEEIYNKYLKHYNIIKVFDDRPRVIRMWRKHGLDVEDVGNGIEF